MKSAGRAVRLPGIGERYDHWKVRSVHLLAAGALLAAMSACTTGDGEGARYIGRVASVADDVLCVGPNSSSPRTICGRLPKDLDRIPQVGQCVSLFASKRDDKGNVVAWSLESLHREVRDSECSQTSANS